MVITTLEANVKEENWSDLRNKFKKMTEILPKEIIQAYLTQSMKELNIWRGITIWKSMEELMEYRKTVEIPEGIKLFRSVGVEPSISIFEIKENSYLNDE